MSDNTHKTNTTDLEAVTAFVAVPRCLETGTVVQVEGRRTRSGAVLECRLPWDPTGRTHALFAPDWHERRADAVARACELRDAQVRKLEDEVLRLQRLTFQE